RGGGGDRGKGRDGTRVARWDRPVHGRPAEGPRRGRGEEAVRAGDRPGNADGGRRRPGRPARGRAGGQRRELAGGCARGAVPLLGEDPLPARGGVGDGYSD